MNGVFSVLTQSSTYAKRLSKQSSLSEDVRNGWSTIATLKETSKIGFYLPGFYLLPSENKNEIAEITANSKLFSKRHHVDIVLQKIQDVRNH